MKIAENHNQLMPYVILKEAKKFIAFAEKHFGAKTNLVVPRDENLIMHAQLNFGKSTMMLADSTEEFKVTTGMFYLYVKNVDETFNAVIAEGCKEIRKPFNEEYGARTAGFIDLWGNNWWINSLLS